MRGVQARWTVTVVAAALTAGTVACRGGEKREERASLERELTTALQDRAVEPELRDIAATDEPGARREEAAPRGEEAAPRAPAEPRAEERPGARRGGPPVPAEAGREPGAGGAVPAEPAPVPTAVESEVAILSAPAGVTFRVELTGELSTATSRVGDGFTARLVDPIVGGRFVVAPAETLIRGRVTALQRPGAGDERAVIQLAFDEILVEGEYYPIHASVVEAELRSRSRQGTGEKAAKIGGGAAAGALLGRIIGGDAKGAVIGGVVGAAAGTAITLATDGRDAVLPEGSRMTLRLDAPLEVKVYR